ncbi:MAG: ABC transporter permease [Thermomicrobiales bacterium]|jgi:ABC-type dipeptide/oligopeptide/nickel transport system permease component|nr:ABC transporter permease [Thermomicrobiales bacterium]
MIRYVFLRLIYLIPTVFLIALVTFIIMQLTPGSPFMLGNMERVTPAMRERLEDMYGLNDPKVVQFGRYIGNSLKGDFGESYVYKGQEIRDIIGRTFPVSLQLGFQALLLAVTIGVTLGVIAAVNQNGPGDYVSMTLAILFYAMPNFVLGYLLLLTFVVWLPDHGLDLGFNVSGWDRPIDKVLPTIALAAAPLAALARYTRGSMIEVIRSDYVRTARAKGLAERKVVTKHVLKNALIPVITLIGPIFAAIGTGTFFVEVVFNVPGMGRFYVDAMTNKDQPLILAVVLVYGVFLAMMNILVDVVNALIDPRIRY